MYIPATPALPAPPPVQLGALESQGPGGDPQPVAHARPVPSRLHITGAQLDVLAGRTASVTGALRPAQAGTRVVLQLREGRHWRTVAGTHTGARGRFRLRYRPARIGSERARVRFAGDARARGSHRRLGALNVFRLAGASWYGGGGSLACGGWLTSATLGVANKTLPCGTLVTLRYGGHTLRVPVVDRGPYVAGREYDLTEATKRALGFEGTGDVWATA
jgi:hypothetical protein